MDISTEVGFKRPQRGFVNHALAYVLMMGVTLTCAFVVLKMGPDTLPAVANAPATTQLESSATSTVASEANNPLSVLLLSIVVILAFSRICARGAACFGQPQVIGEMIAGILLGRSALAILWPEAFHAIFPPSVHPLLNLLSQIGLIFFMFIVGLEIDRKTIKDRARAALMVSHASIVFPFLLGTLLALGLYSSYAPAGVPFASFALFMGVAMSITAFPVLARIIQENGLAKTPLGGLALTCAAVDDVTAWFILAAIVGTVKAGSPYAALETIGFAFLYIGVMIKVIGPLLEKTLKSAQDRVGKEQYAVLFVVLMGSAWVAELIGIHALFGAFLTGAIMPQRESLRAGIQGRTEDLVSAVFLPLFFVTTGLRVQVDLLHDLQSWLVCGSVIVVAVAGKLLASAFAARFSGIEWPESWAIGILMNTRGLMELVVLNIGYDLGILSPKIFAIMVIMALVTTIMTGPLLRWVLRAYAIPTSFKKEI